MTRMSGTADGRQRPEPDPDDRSGRDPDDLHDRALRDVQGPGEPPGCHSDPADRVTTPTDSASPPASPAAPPARQRTEAAPGVPAASPGGSSADELVDVVDEQDRVVGRARRADAYAQRLRHRCVFVLVRDSDGRIFVHRRTASKLVFPSHYDMFVGGVVGAGETYDAAAAREAREELGAPLSVPPRRLFTFLYENPTHTWWSAVYEAHCDVPVRPQPDEVAWHAFLTDSELDRRFREWIWTPDSAEAYRRLRQWYHTTVLS